MLHIHWIRLLSDFRILKECTQRAGAAIGSETGLGGVSGDFGIWK